MTDNTKVSNVSNVSSIAAEAAIRAVVARIANRLGERWRVTRMTLRTFYQTGNRNLLAQASGQ